MSVQENAVAIVGATGLVGLEMQDILKSRSNLDIKLFASTERVDEKSEVKILALSKSFSELAKCRYVLNAASSDVAETLKENLSSEQLLIDNSSAFRMYPEVPLVVPEVNGECLKSKPQIVANPNCTAILLCLTLNRLKTFGLQRVTVATYQAASGAGIKALEELDLQLKAMGCGDRVPKAEVFPYQLANNVLSHNTQIRDEGGIGAGYNEEEWKVIEESRKIIDILHLPISATCIRVPVRRAHTEAVSVDLSRELKLEELREAFKNAPGIRVVDDWKSNHFPMPLEAEGQDEILVGRFRKDPSLAKTVHFMLSGDQIRKGAALNAIQIMDLHLSYQV